MSASSSEQTLWSVSTVKDKLDMSSLVMATQKLQLTSSVGSMYPYVEWVVDMPLNYIEEGYLIVGSGLNFTFNDEKSQSQFTYTFYIESFQYREITADVSAPVTVSFILTTSYKFLDEIKCKAYYGNVREILEQVTTEELIPAGAIKKLKVVKGIDTPMKRFRTYQTTEGFITSRLADSYRGEEETFTYIFSDLDTNMYAYHVYGAINELPIYHCFHSGNHNIEKLSALADTKNARPYMSLMEGMSASINLNRDMWQAANAGISMLYRTNTAKKLNDLPVFRMFPPMDIGKHEMLPMESWKKKTYDHLTRVYIMDDQNDYSKEYTALSSNRNLDLFKSLKVEVITDINLNIKPGHIMKLYPPSYKMTAPILASMFEGNWLISEVDHLFQRVKGKTHIVLQSTSIAQRENSTYDVKYYRQE